MDMYKSIKFKELKEIVKNCEFVLKNQELKDSIDDDGNTHFVSTFYNPHQHFGTTDYRDHRRDSLRQLKALVLKGMFENLGRQRLHFYNHDKTAVNKMLVWGYLGGYAGQFIYKDNKNGIGR